MTTTLDLFGGRDLRDIGMGLATVERMLAVTEKP